MVKGVKRCACVLLLLPCVLFSAYAAVKIDGHVHWNEEYGMRPMVLVALNAASNNAVAQANVCWRVSEEDRSVCVGVQYTCKDLDVMLRQQRERETSVPQTQTGIEVSINGERCFTALLDGTITDWNRDRFHAEARFTFVDDSDTDNWETNGFDGEIYIGLKYWMPYDSKLGLRILDCSGEPSNYYEIPIYPSPTATAAAAETTQRTTTEKQTRAETTTQIPDEPQKQTTKAHTTVRVITAASTAARISKAVNTSARDVSLTEKPTNAAGAAASVTAAERLPEPVGTTVRLTDSSTKSEIAEPSASQENASALQDETAAARKTFLLHNTKLLGVTAATVLITAAFMTSVFLGIQKKQSPQSAPDLPEEEENPDEEYDDF